MKKIFMTSLLLLTLNAFSHDQGENETLPVALAENFKRLQKMLSVVVSANEQQLLCSQKVLKESLKKNNVGTHRFNTEVVPQEIFDAVQADIVSQCGITSESGKE